MPPPWKINGNPKGGGGSQKPKFVIESMKLNWNFKRDGGGGPNQKPSVEGYGFFLQQYIE